MSHRTAPWALVYMLATALSFASCTTNLALTPAQVLLPSTSFYTAPKSKDIIKIHVQVLIRVEPRVCVSWEVQNPDLLRLFPPNNEENFLDYSILPPSGLREGCSSSIWAASIPNAATAAFSAAGESLRSWVFSYDAATKSRAGAEVIISPMKSIQFETRNRRIAVNQIATLKIVGHDQHQNTFTSLEGIPFEARIEDPNIMQIIDPRNDPEVATRARISLLDRKDRFAVSSGYSLTSDVIVLQGKTVGRTKISVRLMLPEYKDIVLKDVEFTVSDSIDLEPSRLVMPPQSKFTFCINKIKPQSVVDGLWDSKVNFSNYTWSTEGGSGNSIAKDGTLTTGKAGSGDFRVVLTDKRNSEAFVSDVMIRVPSKLSATYGGLQDMLECFATKGLDIQQLTSLSGAKLADALQQQLYRNCQGGMRCGARHLTGGVSAKPFAYLLMGRSYIFDVSMRDQDDYQIYVPEVSKFTWKGADDGILSFEKSSNGRLGVVQALKEGLSTLVIEMASPKVQVEISVSVTNPVYLVGFPLETMRWTDQNSGRQETVAVSNKPLLLPIHENAKLVPRGGSGEYMWHVDDNNLCSVKNGVLRCKEYGSTVLTLADKLNPENQFKVQIITKKIGSISSSPANLHAEVGTSAQIKVVAYADISGVTPMFSKTWDTAFQNMGQFYFCMTMNRETDDPSKKVNCRVQHDQFMLDLSAVTEEPFSCGVFTYRAMHPGETHVSITLMDEEVMQAAEGAATSNVIIYDRLSLSIHPEYNQLPFKVPPQPFMNVSQGAADGSILANVAIGAKIRLMVKGGPPMQTGTLSLATCNPKSTVLYVEKVNLDADDANMGRSMFDVYCRSETAGEKICISVDGALRNEFTISCRLPSYVEIHPLVTLNNLSVYDNLMRYSGSRLSWDEDDLSSGMLGTGSNLCFKDDTKTYWQVKLNAQDTHAFRAVVFDAFGNLLAPNHSFKVLWKGTAISEALKSDDLTFQAIDNSLFFYKANDFAEKELQAYLEWPDSFDTKNVSSQFSSLMKPRAVTSLVTSSKMWKKSPDRRGVYVLMSTMKLFPTLPHEILVDAGKSSTDRLEKRVSLFFNPKMRYQFAVILGSGNYVEFSAFSESIKLQHSTTATYSSVEEFSKAMATQDGLINLFNPLSVRKHLTKDGVVLQIPISVKFMSFVCTGTCARSLEIADRSQLGQVTKTLALSQMQVSKLTIILSEITDDFEDFEAMSNVYGGLNILTVKRQYRLHAVALDGNGVPMSYASLNGVKFSVCNNTLVKMETPKDLGYISVGNAMVIQCLAEGKYTIKAEIQNYKSLADAPNGSVITESLEITAVKEVKPVLSSIVMLPNSEEFQISMLDSMFTRNLPTQTLVMESSNEEVLKVVKANQLGYIRSLVPGSCTLVSYIPSGNSVQSRTATPVTVAVPYALSIRAPLQVLNGNTVVLHAELVDKKGKNFTPVFVMGASESDGYSYCVFTWSLNGQGSFIEDMEKLPTISGAGKSRVTLQATSLGHVVVNLKASCRNMGKQPNVDLTAARVTIDIVMPQSIFGSALYPKTIIAADGLYKSQAGMVETVNHADSEIVSILSKDLIKTHSKSGHVLLKTADNHVSHVHIRQVDQLHIRDESTSTGVVNVMKSGKKELDVFLKTSNGQLIHPPDDVKLKTIVSHSALFRATVLGNRVTVSANALGGCAALMVIMEEKEDQSTDAGLVFDLVRVCVSNALSPQSAVLFKGSALHFMAGDTTMYGITLDGIPLAKRYGKLHHQSSLRYYQDVLLPSVDLIVGDLKSDLLRACVKVFRDMIIPEEECADAFKFHAPLLDVSQYHSGLKPLYTFPFSVSRGVDSSIFMAKLTGLLQEFAKTGEGIISLMEGGISALPDHAGYGWSVDEPAIVWVKDSQGLAINAGKAVVRFEGETMKGDSTVEVHDKVLSVELQHCVDVDALTDKFQNKLAYLETHSPFYIVFKATSEGGYQLKNTLQIDSKVLAICEFTGSEAWLNEVFIFEPTFLPHRRGEFIPACRASVRSFGGKHEWYSLKNLLKGASESVSGVKLHVSLHSTLPSDYKSSTINPTTYKPAVNHRALWTTIRKADVKLWENSFDWKVPMFAQFVDEQGVSLDEAGVEAGKTLSLSVYPNYNRCKVTVDNTHYHVRVTERQGLLCSFTLGNDGIVESATVKLQCGRSVIARLKVISKTDTPLRTIEAVARSTQVYQRHNFDLLLTIFTGVVAGAFAYLVYTLLHKPAVKYYETTEPIKIERTIPNVFEKLYQADYHGSYAPTTAQYKHRRM